ncbi:MAG: hypothetical protein ACM3Q4_06545, partial [Acidobacteriota bacterium]
SLDKSEKEIERESDSFQPVSAKTRGRIGKILESARKTKNVNIRISEADLDLLKERSLREGLPYQTMIASIIHRYVTDRLVDEAAIKKYMAIIRHGS